MKSMPKRLLTVVATVIVSAPAAIAMPFTPSLFGGDIDQFNEQFSGFERNTAGGTFLCTTDGDYDAAAQTLIQSGGCPMGAPGSPDPIASSTSFTFNLYADVDNAGNLFGGNFEIVGMPDGGAPGELDILAVGSVLDVFYGSFPGKDINLSALLRIEPSAITGPSVIDDLGEFVLWSSFTTMSTWIGEEGGVAPWSVSAVHLDNFTGSRFDFYRSVPQVAVSAPAGTLLLISACLGMLVGRRRTAQPSV